LAGDSASSIQEVATATRVAEELLQKNQIAEAELEIEMGSQEQVLEDQEALTDWKERQTVWQNILLTHLVKAYNCEGILNQKNGRLGFYAIGRPSDLSTVRYQYCYFVLELTRLASLLAPKTLIRGSGKTWHKSFYLGAVRAIGDGMAKVKQDIKITANSSALAIIDQHAQEALDLRRKLYPKSKGDVSFRSKYDREAWELGNKAGRNMGPKPGLGQGVRGLLGS
jgi:hypothetical protein